MTMFLIFFAVIAIIIAMVISGKARAGWSVGNDSDSSSSWGGLLSGDGSSSDSGGSSSD